jgi:ABC-type iron transport system FetAB ATPase subunit
MSAAQSPKPLRVTDLSVGSLGPVSLTVAGGEVVGLSGASGAGKSRFLRAIADLDPHRGAVALGDEARERWPGHTWRQQVMLVPSESAWWADTVGAHFPPGEAGQTDALTALGFPPEVLDWAVSRLSSGEKQRLALVRARARQPSALLLDEPTANLDPTTTRLVEDWLLAWIAEAALPVLWVAHDAAQLERVAARRLRIAGAELVAAP